MVERGMGDPRGPGSPPHEVITVYARIRSSGVQFESPPLPSRAPTTSSPRCGVW
jgi:hypothetical protein